MRINNRPMGMVTVLGAAMLFVLSLSSCKSSQGVNTPPLGKENAGETVDWRSAEQRPAWTYQRESLENDGWHYQVGLAELETREDFAREDAEADAMRRLAASIEAAALNAFSSNRHTDAQTIGRKTKFNTQTLIQGAEPVEWYTEKYSRGRGKNRRHFVRVWVLMRMPEEKYQAAMERLLRYLEASEERDHPE